MRIWTGETANTNPNAVDLAAGQAAWIRAKSGLAALLVLGRRNTKTNATETWEITTDSRFERGAACPRYFSSVPGPYRAYPQQTFGSAEPMVLLLRYDASRLSSR